MTRLDLSKYRKVWSPLPGPQTALLSCPADDIFAGGGKGGGKSDGILGEFALHAQQWAAAARGLCVRRELKQLRDLIARSKELYLPLGAKYNGSDNEWTFPNGATLMFGHINNDSDFVNYQGFGRTRIYVEELGSFKSPEPIDQLIGNLRTSSGAKCKFIATGNFVGPGHGWVKQRYVDPAPTGYTPIPIEMDYDNPDTGERVRITKIRMWIPSTVRDNKYTNTPEYIGNIMRMGGPKQTQALLYGDPNMVDNQFFPEFDIKRHVIQDQFDIPASWTRIHGTDWGGSSPWANLWAAVVPEETLMPEPLFIGGNRNHRRYKGGLPKGALVIFREEYIAQRDKLGNHINAGLRWDISQYARRIHQVESFEPRDEYGGAKIAYRIAGTDMWNKRQADSGPSTAELLYSEFGLRFKKANTEIQKSGTNVGGWEHLRSLLVGRDGRPMIYIFADCVDLIRCLPLLQTDPDDRDYILEGSEDHNCDALRYIVQSRPYINIDDRQFDRTPLAEGDDIQMRVYAPGIDDISKPHQPKVKYERIR